MAQIDDLSSRAKGVLIRDLSKQKELSPHLKGLVDNLNAFIGVRLNWLQRADRQTPRGAVPGAHFNRPHVGDSWFLHFQEQRAMGQQRRGDRTHGGKRRGPKVVRFGTIGGLLGVLRPTQHQGTVRMGLPTISDQVGQYFEQGYLTDHDGLSPWFAPVTKPEDGLENTLCDALHTMRLQLKQYLKDNITDSCWHPPAGAGTETSSAGPGPRSITGPIAVLLHVPPDGIGGVGFYIGTDDAEAKTPPCQFAGEGLCGLSNSR